MLIHELGFLLIAWIMTHSNYVTSSFSSHTDRLRKVVGVFCLFFFFNVILLSDFYMTLILLWGFNFSSLWKEWYFFNIFLNLWEVKSLSSDLSVLPVILHYPRQLIYMSLPGFFPPCILFSVSNSVCFELFLFTQTCQLFLSLAVILTSFQMKVCSFS